LVKVQEFTVMRENSVYTAPPALARQPVKEEDEIRKVPPVV
jgi:hypothetical protein